MRLTKGTVMTRALVELSSEFESIKYGMVTATKSSIKEMLKGVKVEAGDEQDNMICLKELEAGFEAFQMPCSHVFHGDWIKKWQKQSHCGFKIQIEIKQLAIFSVSFIYI
ncbi:hypothetical protein Gotur_030817 [Gossypium turneri]